MSDLGHVGWPPDWDEVVTRAAAGLPVYIPTDPKLIPQEKYRRFAESRGPNSE